jgi:uncharacterized protein
MKHPNQQKIDAFFEAYAKRDMDGIKKVMDENVRWSFPGDHSAAGIKNGIPELIYFFDTMGDIMGRSNVQNEKLVIGCSDDHVVESQRITTNREDGINLDHRECVLWKFKDGKIIEGLHFFNEPEKVNDFFTKVLQ